ncbi:MAG: 16S rRNA (guanine(527)-N(7))-methyltransferase RsmG [Bacteroidota bacterium]
MQNILKYFPELNDHQISQFEKLGPLYKEWNQKINVVSRKDIDNIYDRHILHSMTIAKWIRFKRNAKVLDLGTGGGLPGIPMAILFPETNFTLIDGTGKKIRVVNEIVEALEIQNARGIHTRAEELKRRFDFVICRAVASIDKLAFWSERLIQEKQSHAMPNGLITLKGGDLKEEMNELPPDFYYEIEPLTHLIPEKEFEDKSLVYVQL